MIYENMGTFSSVNSNVLSFVCFFAAVILFVEGAKEARVVYPRLLEERSSNGAMVVKVHDDLTLNLRKGSVAARELRVLTEENGRLVTRFYNGEDIEKNLYEDEEKIATIMVTKTEHGVHMEGLVSPSHRIKPMQVSEKSEDGIVPHEIHEIDEKEMLDKSLTFRRKVSGAVPSERTSWPGGTSIVFSVTIEVFVVLDLWHHKYFKTTEYALWYLCVMVNSANLRYRDASNPKVKLLLTGVEKAEREDYVVSPKPGYLFDDGTIPAFRQHAVLKRSEYGHPDLVYLMTGRNVFTFYNGRLTDAGLGIGYVSGVCTDFYVALGEDEPGLFSGMHTFSHEVAHLLGAKHDGDGPDGDIPGHPGAKNCSWSVGNIMSYINTGPPHHRFSRCSLDQISFVLRRAGKACWTIRSQGTYVQNVYPGMAVSFKQFCMVLPYDKENSTYEYVTVEQATCKVRCHFYRMYENTIVPELGKYKVTFSYVADALDYMRCGNYHVCIRGICMVNPYNSSDTNNGYITGGPDLHSDTEETTEKTTTTTTPATTTTKRRKFWWRHRTRNY